MSKTHLISIVDKCARRLWLIKSNYKNEYYVPVLLYLFKAKFHNLIAIIHNTIATNANGNSTVIRNLINLLYIVIGYSVKVYIL